ncbi:hypothetical protein NL108_013757 [Boleophthalmus pectinirostris]|nr:hypothetical protein NL108_013757 [Boleophthalmus pectinirostris]
MLLFCQMPSHPPPVCQMPSRASSVPSTMTPPGPPLVPAAPLFSPGPGARVSAAPLGSSPRVPRVPLSSPGLGLGPGPAPRVPPAPVSSTGLGLGPGPAPRVPPAPVSSPGLGLGPGPAPRVPPAPVSSPGLGLGPGPAPRVPSAPLSSPGTGAWLGPCGSSRGRAPLRWLRSRLFSRGGSLLFALLWFGSWLVLNGVVLVHRRITSDFCSDEHSREILHNLVRKCHAVRL